MDTHVVALRRHPDSAAAAAVAMEPGARRRGQRADPQARWHRDHWPIRGRRAGAVRSERRTVGRGSPLGQQRPGRTVVVANRGRVTGASGRIGGRCRPDESASCMAASCGNSTPVLGVAAEASRVAVCPRPVRCSVGSTRSPVLRPASVGVRPRPWLKSPGSTPKNGPSRAVAQV